MIRRAATVALTGVLAVGLAGCGVLGLGPSNGSVSACYRAIPAAQADVRDGSARLVGVHRIAVDRAESHLPRILRRAGDDDTSVCAVVLHGHFAAGQVGLARTDEQGDYAVVLVGSSNLRILAAFVLDHVPHGLGGRFA